MATSCCWPIRIAAAGTARASRAAWPVSSAPAGPIERAGPYQIQAAIAACHACARSWDATDWREIVALYRRLGEVAPSPVVELNRAAAIGMAEGPEAGLAALDRLDANALATYHLWPAARADFLRRLGRWVEAAGEYRKALRLADNVSERRFLAQRLGQCEDAGASPEGTVKSEPQVQSVVDLVGYQDGAVVSRTVVKQEAGNVTLFAFDAGQELSEHTAAYDALVFVLDGEAEITIAGRPYRLRAGDMILMPAREPHAVKALARFKMMLTMIRS